MFTSHIWAHAARVIMGVVFSYVVFRDENVISRMVFLVCLVPFAFRSFNCMAVKCESGI